MPYRLAFDARGRFCGQQVKNINMNFIVVLASSRTNGNTGNLAQAVAGRLQAEIIDLSRFSIAYFDYEHHNAGDDFLPLIDRLTSFDCIIFATPVYWYSMSAQLKTFFDRLTDVLTINQTLGRKLQGTSVSVIATGSQSALPASFTQQFELICAYLGLPFTPTLYCSCPSGFNLQQHHQAIQAYVSNIL